MSGLGRTGGYYPGPSRTGGAYPLTRRVVESLESGRGDSFSTSPTSAVFAENMAIARCVAWDGYEASARLSNNFIPQKMTAGGLLGRWEAILGLHPLPTDTEVVRRARVAAAFARFGTPNWSQPVIDALSAALGSIFVGITHIAPTSAVVWWPAGSITGLSNAQTATAAVPWYSSLCNVFVQLTQPATMTLAQFYAAAGAMNPILDAMLPAWCTYSWYVGTPGFILDQKNLDGLAFA